MRILRVNTVYERGGAAGKAQTLHFELSRLEGWESLFAYGRGPKVKESGVVRFVLQPEVYFHILLTRLTGLQGYGTWLSTRRLLHLIRDWKPDVIHFHNIHGYYLDLSIARAVGKLQIPVVWTLHDGWALTGRCAYFFECNRWKTGCGNCPNLSWYPKTYLDSSAFMWKKKKECFISEWNPVIVCPSQWLADKVKESYLNKFKIKVIPNGVDTEIFKPEDKIEIRKKLKISPDKKVILFVAVNLRDERKGAKYFFEALKYIKADNWMVLTIGKRINLNREVKTAVNIKQLGYISDKNLISDIYNAADVFCITSLDDNFPTTVLESMACGISVVGFKVGGIPEQVSKDCGILVEPKDAKALGEALEKIINDEKMREEFSINCRKRALENYSIEKFKERYTKLYKEVLG